MGLVEPEFGPTLPETVRSLSRAKQLAAGGLAALALLAIVAALVSRADVHTETAVVSQPLAFNLIWRAGDLRRVATRPGELLRLETPAGDPAPQRYVVRALHVPPYRGEAGGALPLFAAGLVDRLRATLPAFQRRAEGRTRVNDLPGYQVSFQTRLGKRLAFGKRVLLLPDEPGAREGADLELISTFSKVVANPDAVGSNGALKTPLRSFRFGTQRP